MPATPRRSSCTSRRRSSGSGCPVRGAWLHALPRGGELRPVHRPPSKTAIKNFAVDTVASGDFVVLYYTAHGVRDGDRFYLQTHDSKPRESWTSPRSPRRISRASWRKTRRAAQVLVILDTCYSGAGSAELMQIANHIAVTQPKGPGLFVIASARPKEEAQAGRALRRARSGPRQPPAGAWAAAGRRSSRWTT